MLKNLKKGLFLLCLNTLDQYNLTEMFLTKKKEHEDNAKMTKNNKAELKSALIDELTRINEVIDLIDNSDKSIEEIIKLTKEK